MQKRSKKEDLQHPFQFARNSETGVRTPGTESGVLPWSQSNLKDSKEHCQFADNMVSKMETI